MRMFMLVLTTTLIVAACATGLTSPASAQESPCDGAAAAQYQYCDSTDVIIVPPPSMPGSPDGPTPTSLGSGVGDVTGGIDVPGGVNVVPGSNAVTDATPDVPVGEDGAAPVPSGAVWSVAPAAADGTATPAVDTGAAAQITMLPDTGGVLALLPVSAGLLLVCVGLLARRAISHK